MHIQVGGEGLKPEEMNPSTEQREVPAMCEGERNRSQKRKQDA